MQSNIVTLKSAPHEEYFQIVGKTDENYHLSNGFTVHKDELQEIRPLYYSHHFLTEEKFLEIYTDKAFRNEIAYAHGQANAQGVRLYNITCSYPKVWIVSNKHIALAKKEKERAKQEALQILGNKLVFVAMGGCYPLTESDNIGCHRFRTEFINRDGRKFFIELGTDARRKGYARIDHAIDRTREIELNSAHDRQGEYYNYKKLERKALNLRMNKKEILEFINREFNCRFSVLEIDKHDLSCNDFVCQSPQILNLKNWLALKSPVATEKAETIAE